MNIDTAFPSKYVKAADLQGQTLEVVIKSVVMEDVGDGDVKPVMYLEGYAKGMILNKTKAETIKRMYGNDTDYWTSRQITIRPDVTNYKGDMVDCIVVVPGQQQAPMQPPVQPQQPTTGVTF